MVKSKKKVSKKSSPKKMNMEGDISNKALAGLLIAAIVISVSGTLMILDKNAGLTGFATSQNANASVNITGTLSIYLSSNSLDFGTGTVNSGSTSALLAYDGTTFTATNGTGFSQTGDIILVNDGNLNANVTIKALSDVATFIGGSSPTMEYLAAEGTEAGSCTGTLASSYTTLSTTKSNFCDVLAFADTSDDLKLGLRLKIPSDTVGYKTNTLVFEAS